MTDIVTGLTTEEVNKLKEQGLDNIPVGNQSKTIGQILSLIHISEPTRPY